MIHKPDFIEARSARETRTLEETEDTLDSDLTLVTTSSASASVTASTFSVTFSISCSEVFGSWRKIFFTVTDCSRLCGFAVETASGLVLL